MIKQNIIYLLGIRFLTINGKELRKLLKKGNDLIFNTVDLINMY